MCTTTTLAPPSMSCQVRIGSGTEQPWDCHAWGFLLGLGQGRKNHSANDSPSYFPGGLMEDVLCLKEKVAALPALQRWNSAYEDPASGRETYGPMQPH